MSKTLRDYQRAELVRCKDWDRLPVFWRMRLGKTLFTIRWLERKKRVARVLIAAPLSILEAWQEELEEEGYGVVLALGSAKQKETALLEGWALGFKYFLTNKEGLTVRRRRGELRKRAMGSGVTEFPWDAVILDESPWIKNPGAAVTKVVCKSFEAVPVKAILTGLPCPESPLDYFEQYRFLHGQFLGCSTFWKFREKYFKRAGFDWYPRPGTLSAIKQEVIKTSTRVTLKSIGVKIERVYEKRKVQLPPSLQKVYAEAERSFVLGAKSTKWTVVKRSWLQQIAGGGYGLAPEFHSDHKLRELVNLLQGELKEEQVVVFFRFNSELRAAARALSAKKISNLSITGAVSREERIRLRKKFQAGDTRIALLQPRCVRYGLKFSAADTAIYYSNWEEYELRGQSQERILEIGKSSCLLYLDVITENTIDEDIYDALRSKGAGSKAFEARLTKGMLQRACNKEVDGYRPRG